MTSLSDPKVLEFLSQGTRTAKLAFVTADGRPVINPVWFVVEGDELVFNTGKDTAKGKAIRRDPRVSICVDLEEQPYGYYQIQGTATISEDPAELVRTATVIGGRYMGADRAEEFGKRNGVPGELVVRVRPTKILGGVDMTG
ncbi:PPOX class F420-dependent oxidoreductase [Nocardia pseudobrasiliensis]|uniref:PPOX class probable F420-dependent enzyme/PPOX class probable F420-dependent enzyme n=1 Tax=Nocardia pseudobrasiliensis TaxID=45979 RepID=A0A370I781_9NOCA|nr:PPOX class F420-dependent oxidoreductase [Nocardia pseudobrasiliensis]RDI66583.1 PPOX class probable F420-dependent enzyme/PPOX class probable F420-dependent enzyme [Nocardia pseudobrasiliensis]